MSPDDERKFNENFYRKMRALTPKGIGGKEEKPEDDKKSEDANQTQKKERTRRRKRTQKTQKEI